MLFIAQAMIIVHLVIYFDCWSLRLAFLFNRILKIGIKRLLVWLFIKTRWQRLDVSVFQPLSPHEITLIKSLFLALDPPTALLKDLFNEHVIIPTTYVVLVCTHCLIGRNSLLSDSVSLVYAIVQSSEHFFPHS